MDKQALDTALELTKLAIQNYPELINPKNPQDAEYLAYFVETLAKNLDKVFKQFNPD